jgi:hypothetical protein
MQTPSPVPCFAATATERASAWGLAAALTLSVLLGLGQTADHHHDEALLAQAASTMVHHASAKPQAAPAV